MKYDWSKGDTPVSELTFEDFYDFCKLNAGFVFFCARKVTADNHDARDLSVDVLARVMLHESVVDKADETVEVYPRQAIENAFRHFLDSTQMEVLQGNKPNPMSKGIVEFLRTDDGLDLLDDVIDGAVEKVRKEMPRYAQPISGTAGAFVILGIVAAIVAVIVLVWLDPLGRGTDAAEVSGSDSRSVSVFTDINSGLLVDIECEPVYSVGECAPFNTGAVPVRVSVTGPDIRRVIGIEAFDSQGGSVEICQCGVDGSTRYETDDYCFAAMSNEVYEIRVHSETETVSGFVNIHELSEVESLSVSAPYYIVPHNQSTELGVLVGTGYVAEGVSPSDAAPAVLSGTAAKTAEPLLGTAAVSSEGNTIVYTPRPDAINSQENPGGGCIDCVAVRVKDENGAQHDYSIPVIVCNNAPAVDPACLTAAVRHTPTHSGLYAARLSASDADGDALRFELVSSEGCSVLLAPNGCYVASINDKYSGFSARFTFTVSDGLITTSPYTVTLALSNSLITETTFSQDFVCYSGENGWYAFNLPAVDTDGDPLTWKVVSPLGSGNKTEKGSELKAMENGSVIRCRLDPSLDESFNETIQLVCTDGWKTSEVIFFTMNVAENRAPVSGGNNRSTLASGAGATILELNVIDDCQFDKSVITAVNSVVGGSVEQNTGWDELKFTFTPDGTDDYCVIELVVTDTVSGKSTPIRYTVTIE